jgi:arginyl-tRNA synthetase
VTLYVRFAAHMDALLDAMVAAGDLPSVINRKAVTVEPPRDASHGDLATNAAMVLAKAAGTNPRALAEKIAARLDALDEVASVSIAGPGFINMSLTPETWAAELRAIEQLGADYGRSDSGAGVTVNVEYVSANPTGPMHMGHCRGAVVGDALATLLEAIGHKVIREYYINDAGGQVDVLARSVHLRYREALGEDIGEIPEGLYPGDYLVPVGQASSPPIMEPSSSGLPKRMAALFRGQAVAAMMDMIRDDLALLGIHHDVFASEAELQAAKKPKRPKRGCARGIWSMMACWKRPRARHRKTGSRSSCRCSVRPGSATIRTARSRSPTAAGPISARIWPIISRRRKAPISWSTSGARTMRARSSASRRRSRRSPRARRRFDVKLVQMVRLLRDGEPVKMSKRAGNFVTLADVVREVGKDVVRFTMLTRKADAQMDFDFAKVVEASKDNPVFYVQYAHARIASLGRRAAEAGVELPAPDLSRLGTEELALVKLAAQYPRIIEAAAQAREPHRIAFFLGDLAAAFHGWWNMGNDDAARRIIVVNDPETTSVRLFLARQIGQIVRNGLALMGVEALSEMQ